MCIAISTSLQTRITTNKRIGSFGWFCERRIRSTKGASRKASCSVRGSSQMVHFARRASSRRFGGALLVGKRRSFSQEALQAVQSSFRKAIGRIACRAFRRCVASETLPGGRTRRYRLAPALQRKVPYVRFCRLHRRCRKQATGSCGNDGSHCPSRAGYGRSVHQ